MNYNEVTAVRAWPQDALGWTVVDIQADDKDGEALDKERKEEIAALGLRSSMTLRAVGPI